MSVDSSRERVRFLSSFGMGWGIVFALLIWYKVPFGSGKGYNFRNNVPNYTSSVILASYDLQVWNRVW